MVRDSACVKHPDNEVVGKCAHCRRPYCAACEVRSEHGAFCSLECKGRYHDFREREAGLGPMKRSRRWLRLAIGLVVLGIVGYGLYAYFVRKDPTLRQVVDQAAMNAQKTLQAPR